MIDVENPLPWMALFAGIAVALQSIELLLARRYFDDRRGIWRFSDLEAEFSRLPKPFSALLVAALPAKRFTAILWLRMAGGAALLFLPHPLLLGALVVLSLLVSIRWRGLLNGGSDYMTIIVLTGLLLASAFPDSELVVLGAVYYVAIQAALSYFVAGVVKLRSPNWRSGAALRAFLASGIYTQPKWLMSALCKPWFARLACWGVMAFELALPASLVSHEAAILLLPLGLIFHLLNSYLLGLSRFAPIWLATYPAILWMSAR